jgi:PKD repeat protein
VTYGATGTYTVILTASNASGSTSKTKTNFVIVTN